ncbi:hypothetical protein [Ralstonia pseudosolanacearum]|uniref:hypothetical protein n=1 Tax=Ralstonia pseudosolanacearum TaxID=1310165 RepID=UPI001E2CD304|nr:hypothetical protein [Ralstonia pseudosolanacearum]
MAALLDNAAERALKDRAQPGTPPSAPPCAMRWKPRHGLTVPNCVLNLNAPRSHQGFDPALARDAAFIRDGRFAYRGPR